VVKKKTYRTWFWSRIMLW